MAEETKLPTQGTMMEGSFFQAYTDLSLHLTGGNTHSLTEGCTDERLKWDGKITLLTVVD
jgi:hypothetical protein